MEDTLKDVSKREVGEIAVRGAASDASVETTRETGNSVLLGDADAFGQTGGTRGVADGVDVIRTRRGHGLAVSLTDGLDFRERVDGQAFLQEEFLVLVGDFVDDDQILQEMIFLQQGSQLQSGGGHTNDGLQLGLVEDECNTVISKCIVDGDQGELIGVTTVLRDAPLDAVLAENTNALVTKFLMNQVLLN